MGVPTFFRWLTTRYPKVIRDAIERQVKESDGRSTPVDLHEPAPNGEYDILYLDMNALIHPCCHPDDGPPPVNEDHMIELIFLFIDRMVRIVRPKKLLYMAIDGVAPRAKMNQQRARRFRAAQERREATEELEKLHVEWDKEGRCLPKKHNIKEPFDSNVITPGTPFMLRLADALKFYIHDRANNDPTWLHLKFNVIFSDCQQPGEGEHKIMDFIRGQRAQPEYDPNTRHMLYGADADLIVLGLATHETHFHIIREVVIPKQDTKCTMCGAAGHVASECMGNFGAVADDDDDDFVFEQKPFQIVSLPILRQYLGLQFGAPLQDVLPNFDFERIIDDFVFFCFFVGNDFLPHLPSLHIRDGSVDQMITLYIELLPELGDYLTNSGTLNLEICEKFVEYIGGIEDQVFKNRLARDKSRKEYVNTIRPTPEEVQEPPAKKSKYTDEPVEVIEMPEQVEASKDCGTAWHASLLGDSFMMDDLPDEEEEKKKPEDAVVKIEEDDDAMEIDDDTKPIEVKEEKTETEDPKKKSGVIEKGAVKNFYETMKARLESRKDLGYNREDTVRLGEGNAWKQRYYFEKFGLEQEDLVEFLQNIRRSYVEGLCWVLSYYYQGCPSWTWYYPYHYAPFASDLIGMDSLDCSKPDYFTLSKPFTPYQQLMSVLPPDSAERCGLPKECHDLMVNKESPILDFYPMDFDLDLNGKRFTWQAVILLPFIDEPRLIETLTPHLAKLEGDHKKRNELSDNLLFGLKNHHLGKVFEDVEPDQSFAAIKDESTIPLRNIYCPLGYGRGKIIDESIKSAFDGVEDVDDSELLTTIFDLPESKKHDISLLSGATFEAQAITNQDESHMRWLKGFGGEHARRMILEALGRDWKKAKWGDNWKGGLKRGSRASDEATKQYYEQW